MLSRKVRNLTDSRANLHRFWTWTQKQSAGSNSTSHFRTLLAQMSISTSETAPEAHLELPFFWSFFVCKLQLWLEYSFEQETLQRGIDNSPIFLSLSILSFVSLSHNRLISIEHILKSELRICGWWIIIIPYIQATGAELPNRQCPSQWNHFILFF